MTTFVQPKLQKLFPIPNYVAFNINDVTVLQPLSQKLSLIINVSASNYTVYKLTHPSIQNWPPSV